MKKLLMFLLLAATLPLMAQRPVVFLHGYGAFGSSDGSIWSKMKTLLKDNAGYSSDDLHAFSYYDSPFGYSTSTPIETVAEGVAREITEIYYDSGNQPVDIVAHSMGGLVVRAMLAYDLIDRKCLGKFITLGTPHYGQNIDLDLAGKQARQMKYGSLFLWNLADAWHFQGKQIQETLCIAGAADSVNGSNWDGLVHVWSAALGNAPCRYVDSYHSPMVSDSTIGSTAAGAVIGGILGGPLGLLIGGIFGNEVGQEDTPNVIYECKKGKSDDVFVLVKNFLASGYVYPQSALRYSSPSSKITSQGGIFFQIVDSNGVPAKFSASDSCLVHTYWHVEKDKRIVADYLDHGDDDTESQKKGVEFVYGTMPVGTYNLTGYASQTTKAFTVKGVSVSGGRVTVVRIRVASKVNAPDPQSSPQGGTTGSQTGTTTTGTTPGSGTAADGGDSFGGVDLTKQGAFAGVLPDPSTWKATPYTATATCKLRGAVYSPSSKTALGVIELKLGKMNKKSRKLRISGSIRWADGKSCSIKSLQVVVPQGAPITTSLTVKKLGTLDIVIGGNGFLGTIGDEYVVQSAQVGGAWTKTGSSVVVDFANGSTLPSGTLVDYLPDETGVITASGKWKFAKMSGMKLKRAGGGYYRILVEGTIANPSNLKITYNPSKGTFKGTFKMYVGTSEQAKSSTVKVMGIVVEGVGVGYAQLPGTTPSTWSLRVE